jgi:hypothetical protein
MYIVTMRWEEKSRRPKYLLGIPCIHAREIIVDAYRQGYINWIVYQRVMEKINSHQNGGWMFEKGNVKIDFGKVYRI